MGFQYKLLLPALGAAALFAVAAILSAAGIALSPWLWLVACSAILSGAWLVVDRYAQRPLLQLAARAAAASAAKRALQPHSTDALALVEQSVAALSQTLSSANEQLERERQLRQQSEGFLRELEERHALALRCVNDGLWEWDLKSDAVYYAPTWKSSLGFGEHEIGTNLNEWRDRIHPDDRDLVLRKLDEHVRGDTPMFECDQRLLHRDGRYRWFLTRGRAVRSASGKPYKVIGLNTDISARKRAEEILNGIAHGLSTAAGADFFRQIVKNFAQVLGVKYAFITECMDHPPTRLRMLAAWMDGAYSDTLEYDLPGTPCEITIRGGEANLIAEGLEALYPADVGYHSYLGIPICDAAGRVLGHLACLDVRPMEELPLLPIFSIFALRAGIEMQHQLLLRSLEQGRTNVLQHA